MLDVLAVTTARRTGSAKAKVAPRVAIAEIKVRVSDLRSDLRARKMFRYQPQATHLYLAGPEAVISRAERFGLPDWWGLVEVAPSKGRGATVVTVTRRPKRNPHAPEPTKELRAWWVNAAAISLAHRALRRE